METEAAKQIIQVSESYPIEIILLLLSVVVFIAHSSWKSHRKDMEKDKEEMQAKIKAAELDRNAIKELTQINARLLAVHDSENKTTKERISKIESKINA